MGKRENNAKRQRKLILRAAAALFSKKGYHKASVGEIAERAGVGKGTIYLYFADKAQLFAATVTEGMEEIIGGLRAELESDLPFRVHFQRLVERHVALYLQHEDLTGIFHREMSNGIDRQTLKKIEEVRRRYVDFLADTLADGHRRGYIKAIDFHLAAVGVVGLVDVLCSDYWKNERPLDRGEIAATVYSLLSTGLTAPEKAAPAARGKTR